MWQGIVNDVHPPVYYFLLKPFSQLLGWTPFILRFFSTVFSTASIWLVYKIVKKILIRRDVASFRVPQDKLPDSTVETPRWGASFAETAALSAAFITAISPFQIQYAQEARQYALMGFWALCSIYFLTRRDATHRVSTVIAGIFLSLTFLTQYAGILATPAVLLFLFFIELDLKQFKLRESIKNFSIESGLLLTPVVLTFAAWFPIFKQHRENMGNPAWIPAPTISRLFQTIYTFVFGEWPKQTGVSVPNESILRINPSVFGLLILLAIVLLVGGCWLVDKKKKSNATNNCQASTINIVFLLFTLTVLAESYILAKFLGVNFYMERYLFPASFGIYISLGLVIAKLEQLKKYTGITLLVIITLLAFTIKHKPIDTRFQALAQEIPDNTYQTIVATSPFDYSTALFYLHEKASNFKIYNKGNPQEDVTGWVVIGENQIYSLEGVDSSKSLIIE